MQKVNEFECEIYPRTLWIVYDDVESIKRDFETSDEEAIEEDKPAPIKIDWYKVVIPVSGGVAFTLLLFAIDRLLKRRRYIRLSERGKATVLCRNSLELLGRKHLGRNREETLSEYAERLLEDLTEEQIAFIRTYEEILYSDRDVSEEERKLMEERFTELRKFFQGRAVRQFVTYCLAHN